MGVGVGVGVAVGAGVNVGVAVGVDVGSGVGVAVGVGVGVAVGAGVDVGMDVGVDVGSGVGMAAGVGVCVAVGSGVGVGSVSSEHPIKRMTRSAAATTSRLIVGLFENTPSSCLSDHDNRGAVHQALAVLGRCVAPIRHSCLPKADLHVSNVPVRIDLPLTSQMMPPRGICSPSHSSWLSCTAGPTGVGTGLAVSAGGPLLTNRPPLQ